MCLAIQLFQCNETFCHEAVILISRGNILFVPGAPSLMFNSQLVVRLPSEEMEILVPEKIAFTSELINQWAVHAMLEKGENMAAGHSFE